MTTTTVETPNLDTPVGQYAGSREGGGRVTHVRRLLERATVANTGKLTPVIINSMRRHYQVSSCLLVQSLPLVRADWDIECEDDRIRKTLTAAYEAIAFDVHRSMTRALWAGNSPNEIVWTYREDLRGIYPGEIRDLAPSTCVPQVDENGTLDGFVQKVAGSNDIVIEQLYTLWIAEGMESGNYYGRSLLEAALDPWSDHAAFRAFHARYLERFGEPVVLCRAPDGKTIANAVEIEQAVLAKRDDPTVVVPTAILENTLDTALRMGENLRHHSVVALPSSLLFGADGKPTGFAWNLEYLEAKAGGGTDFLEALNTIDLRISRAMFVPDLLSQNTASVGSNALGQTHKSVWDESVEGRLDDYSRQITAQIIDRARRLNFGDGSAPARLVFKPLVDEDRERLWTIVTGLLDKGELPVDGYALAEEYGLPTLSPEEAAKRLEAIAAQTPTTPAAPPAVTNAGQHAAHAFASVDPNAGLPDWRTPQAGNGSGPFARELNNREKRVGFAKLETALNGAEAAALTVLTELLDGEHDRILRQLDGILRKGTPAEILAGLGTIEVKGDAKVVKAWADLMATVGDVAVEQLRSELATYADQVRPVGPEGRALFRSYAATSAERVISQILTETRLELLNAYTSGVSRAGMASIVGRVFDAYQGSEGKPVRLTTRMLSAKALNYSRAAGLQNSGIPLAGAQYSAVLDRVTCALCEKLDESVIPITHTDLSRFTPPIHHNCRCVWVWITTDEADFTPTWVTPSNTDVERFGGLVL